jgi:transcriptional regulator with XRE-family HTH domain
MKELFQPGDRIRALLKAKNRTVKELADYLGQSDSTIYHILNNRISLDLGKAMKIAQFFGVSLDDMVGCDQPLNRVGVIEESIRKVIEKEAERIILEKFPELKKRSKKRKK